MTPKRLHGRSDRGRGFASLGSLEKVHVHDLHATMLPLMGFDLETLTDRSTGRDVPLTDVPGRVVKGVLASVWVGLGGVHLHQP